MTATVALRQVSELVAERYGLCYPEDRHADLLRCVQAAARESGQGDAEHLLDELLHPLTGSAALDRLVPFLTVGETYLFRHEAALTALGQVILPELIAARYPATPFLRIWSAGCCTGEEAYSVAMVLADALPDRAAWQVSLLATDINDRFLRKAAAGIYSEWSFRGLPPALRERFFAPAAGGRHQLVPQIRSVVDFAQHNLLAQEPPSGRHTGGMDIIFCCNVLIYFTPEQARRVVRQLTDALADGGWLVTSAVEIASGLFDSLTRVEVPGGTLLRKVQPISPPAPAPVAIRHRERRPAPASTTPKPPARPLPAAKPAPADPLTAVRELADRGCLTEALERVAGLLATDRANARACFVQATIQIELGLTAEAESSLAKALYLDPELAMAHITLGQLLRRRGRAEAGNQHLRYARQCLEALAAAAVVPETGGQTAGRLAEDLRLLLEGAPHGR